MNYIRYVPSRQACKMLGKHPNRLRKWAREGKIHHIKTHSGQRLYDIESFIGNSKKHQRICYCGVSSYPQKDDLARQIQYMQNHYPTHQIIKDIGSGLNFKRKGFISLLERVCRGDIEEIVVAYKDRLCRFGFELLQWIIEHHGGRLVVCQQTVCSPQQELTEDLLGNPSSIQRQNVWRP